VSGLLVTHQGKVVGAFGVSGLDEEQDSAPAHLALEIVK
jgi:uncharacterized protein GlcG (DUF336 family)